jgi:hypothetical protein
MNRHLNIGFALVTFAMIAAAPARAAEPMAPGEETIKIRVGGILARLNTSVGIDGASSTGTAIDLEGNSPKKLVGNVMIGAQWRVGSRHRISGMYFTTREDRSLTFDRTITVGDDTLVPPTTLTSTARNRFLLADYRYSFVKNEDVELAGVIGAYINKFSIDLAGTATVQNNNNGTISNVTRSVAYSPGVTVPMPLVGGSIDWFAAKNLTLGGSLSGMKAKIGDIDGSIFVASVSAEYMFTRNVGVGVAVMHAKLNVDVTKPVFNGHLNWKNDNLLGYVLVKF